VRRFLSCLMVGFLVLIVLFPRGVAAADGTAEVVLLKSLEKCRTITADLLKAVESGEDTKTHLARLKEQFVDIQASHMLLKDQFEVRRETMGARSAGRQQAMRAGYEAFIETLFEKVQTVLDGAGKENVRDLLLLLEQAVQPQDNRPILGTMPYRHLDYAARLPVSEPVVIPAYQKPGADSDPADLALPGDDQVAQKIALLAESLDWNPVAIYEWVKNTIDTEWYHGSMKGAVETIDQQSGNDCDQAAVLVALLRASGYPARYVRGVAEFFPDIDKGMNLTGTGSPEELATFFQKAGIPYEPVMDAGNMVNIRFEHVWVETLVPWSNYRGAALDDMGKVWVALDTGIKALPMDQNTPADLPDEALFSSLRDDYLAAVQSDAPLDYLRARVADALDGSDTTYNDLLLTRQREAEVMHVLPAGLQFSVAAVTQEYAALPEELKHRIRFVARTEGGQTVFDETAETAALSNAFPVLRYEPETIEDQETINAFYGLDNTPSYLVRLRPVITVGQQRLAVGQTGFAPGEAFILEVELIAPAGTTSFSNTHSVGSVSVIGIVAGSPVPLAAMASEDKSAARLLSEVASDYIADWNLAEEELSALLKAPLIRPVPTVATVGCVVEVEWLLGVPVNDVWKGVYLDADLRAVETAGGYAFSGGTDAQELFISLSGLQGSDLEGRTLTRAFDIESVSTAAILGAAAQAGVAVRTIDSGNIATVLPALGLPGYIADDVTAAVGEGYTVRIPETSITILDWTGYGYLKEDGATGESGWMLSGMIAGGMTAGKPERWQPYFDRLKTPGADPSVNDPSWAVQLKKVKEDDFQETVVGGALPRPLEAVVLDMYNRPVGNVDVTFSVKEGGGHFPDNQQEYTVRSNFSGYVSVPYYVGESTADNATLLTRDGETYPQQVGENLIDAVLDTGIAVKTRFTAYGLSDSPDHIVKKMGDGKYGMINTSVGTLKALVEDRLGNPVSNADVTFRVLPAVREPPPEQAPLPEGYRNIELYNRDECGMASPIYGDCSTEPDQLTVTSDVFGAGVEAVLGDTVGTTYTVEASCPGAESVEFKVDSMGIRVDTDGIAPSTLVVNSIYDVNQDGDPVAAAEPGQTIDKPFTIAVYLMRDRYVMEPSDDGYRIRSLDSVEFVPVTDANIDAQVVQGGGSVSFLPNLQEQQAGRYSYELTTGPVPARNTIAFSTEATVSVPAAALIDKDGYPAELPMRTVTLQAGQEVYFETVDGEPQIINEPVVKKLDGFGVNVGMNQPSILGIDDEGLSRCDYQLSYKIEPSDYDGIGAFVLVEENGETMLQMLSESAGTGWGTIARGTWFDENNDYRAHAVLNPGDVFEIQSNEIELHPGAVKVKNILLVDAEAKGGRVAPGESRELQAVTQPSGRTIVWTIRHREDGVVADISSLDSTKAVIQADPATESGYVIVRATDSENSCVFKEARIYIGCPDCGKGQCHILPGGGFCELASIDMGISLGRGTGGQPAGDLFLRADRLDATLTTPAALFLSSTSGQLDARYEEGDLLRQVLAPETLADIVMTDAYGYEIRFYHPADVAGEADGFFELAAGAVPYALWRIENPDGEADFSRLRVTENREGRIRQYDYTWQEADGTWSLAKGGGLQVAQRVTATVDGNRVVTETIKDAQGIVASETRTTYHTFDWGEAVIETVTDPDGAALVTTTDYYDDPEQEGSRGRIASRVNPDGSWQRFVYDDQGRLLQTIAPWLDAGPESAPENARVTAYDYTPVDPADSDAPEDRHRPRTVTETIHGTVVARSYHAYVVDNGGRTEISERCTDVGAAYGAAANLRTVSVYHPSDTGLPESGRVASIAYPDGRMDSYTYERGLYTPGSADDVPGTFTAGSGTDLRQSVVHGTVDHPAGIAFKTTREVTVSSELGWTLMETSEVYDGAGYARLSWSLYHYDDFGRQTAAYRSDGTGTHAVWSCCSKEADTSAEGIETTYGYDALNRVTDTVRLGLDNGTYTMADVATHRTYDAAGRVTDTSVTAGGLTQSTASEYDGAGRIILSTDAAGLETATAYAGGGRITTVTIPGGATQVTETYLDGKVKSVTGTGVVPTYYEYGVNPDGSQWTRVYAGSLGGPAWTLTETGPAGRTLRTEKPGPAGIEVTENVYDAAGRLVRTITPGQADTLYVYDALGNQVQSGLDVDANGFLEPASTDRISASETLYTEISNQLWQETVQQVYPQDNDGTPVTVSIQRSQMSGLIADGEAAESVVIDIHGNATVSHTTIDPAQKMRVQVVDHPDAAIDAQSVTVNGLLVENRSKTNITTTFSYDALGRRTGASDPRTGTTITHYDAYGRVDYVQDPAGHTTSFTYDPATGRKVSETNALSKTTRFAYDDRGQVTHTWGEVPYPVQYVYDAYGRMHEMHTYRAEAGFDGGTFPIGAAGDITRWHYEEATGLLEAKEYADGSQVTYAYTTGGKLLTRTWAREDSGQPLTTTYGYDGATGELVLIDYSDATPDITFAYDRLGRQTQITDAAGSRSFAYNAALQLDTETITGLTPAVITRTYETAGLIGRPTGFNLGAGYSVTYGYDTAGRFGSVGWNVNGQGDTATYSYLADSDLLAGMSTASGQQTTYGYEPQRNLKTSVQNSFNSQVVSQYDYVYDAIGRRTSVANTGTAFAQAAFSKYGYNDRSELIAGDRYLGTDIEDLTNPVAAEQRGYQYDPIGNRSQATEAGTPISYTANELNQYTAVDSFTPAYDADGNMTTAPDGMAYTYNAENRLIMAQPQVPAEGDTRVTFVYDYMGRRVQKTVYAYGSGAWQVQKEMLFVYDGWNVAQEITREGGSDTSRYFVWGLDLSQSLQGAGGVGGLLAMVDGANAYHYCFDANGNVGQLVNAANGEVAAHYEFDPFGNAVQQSGSMVDGNPFRFSTKYQGEETDLYYYGYRYYSADLGRWINRDPFGENGGINIFLFVNNRPISNFDPYGLEGSDTGEITLKGVGGGYAGWELSLHGKTLIKLGDQGFYVSGRPHPKAGMWVPPEGSTSKLLIFKKANPKKVFRVDYHGLNSTGGKPAWHYNKTKGLASIKGLQAANHEVATGAKIAGRTITIFRYAGRAMFIAGVGMSAYDIYHAENKQREIARQVGGWTGALAGGALGAKGGTVAGAGVGVWFAGAGAAPGAAIGGTLGAIGGGVSGWVIGTEVSETVYDWVFTPIEKEEWVIYCDQEAK